MEIQKLIGPRGLPGDDSWSSTPIWAFSPKALKANKAHVYQWDRYCITKIDGSWILIMTMAELGLGSFHEITFIDLEEGSISSIQSSKRFSRSLELGPSSSTSWQSSWFDDSMRLAFIKADSRRRLLAGSPALDLGNGIIGLDADIQITQDPSLQGLCTAQALKPESMQFCLQDHFMGMKAAGKLILGDRKMDLEQEGCLASYEWTRGRWVGKKQWLSAQASGLSGGHVVSICLSSLIDNALCIDGIIHKIGPVDMTVSRSQVEPWIFKDKEGRIELALSPSASSKAWTFGHFSGRAVADDGQVLDIEEMPGFAIDPRESKPDF